MVRLKLPSFRLTVWSTQSRSEWAAIASMKPLLRCQAQHSLIGDATAELIKKEIGQPLPVMPVKSGKSMSAAESGRRCAAKFHTEQ